jgi:hypothetical protein
MNSRALFPLEFQKLLVIKGTNNAHLQKAMARRGYRVTKQFIGLLANGYRRVPAQQLKRMCETLSCTREEAQRLHRAACIDMGFDIGGIEG